MPTPEDPKDIYADGLKYFRSANRQMKRVVKRIMTKAGDGKHKEMLTRPRDRVHENAEHVNSPSSDMTDDDYSGFSSEFDRDYYCKSFANDQTGRDRAPAPAEAPQEPVAENEIIDHEYALAGGAFDAEFYSAGFDENACPSDPLRHYLSEGWLEERDPCEWFSTAAYLACNRDVAEFGINPFIHYLTYGIHEGRSPAPVDGLNRSETSNFINGHDYNIVSRSFDIEYYLNGFDNESRPQDPVLHYITKGWLEYRNPNEWFSTSFYLDSNPDVHRAGINPFVHYINQGEMEGRLPMEPTSHASQHQHRIEVEHEFFAARGPLFEDLDASIIEGRSLKAKIIAFYLPQFHAIPENDEWWGRGFTEWRNVARGLPRFRGHYQPRIPRDLGFYDLSSDATLRRQVDMAAAMGIHGFCFYYYSFNGKRLLSTPTDHILGNADIDFPFCLMWANENWTKTWDGFNNDVLIAQDYRPEDEDAMIDGLAQHFADPRYIRIDDRPLFFIYRPGVIPEALETIQRWRGIFGSRHGLKPLLFMAQGFGDTDPAEFGLDGAIEFPPHKLAVDLPAKNNDVDVLSPTFSGHVLDYDDVVTASLSEPQPSFPLIKTAIPSWDNEARRPGRGMVIHGSTPSKFGDWLRRLVLQSAANPTHGERFVAINAWNEWAEGAYLEPDIHFGGAYLNALARASIGVTTRRPDERRQILIVGHDAHRNGAQTLVYHLGRVMSGQFGYAVSFLICGEGPLLDDYKRIGTVTVIDRQAIADLEAHASRLWSEGVRQVIVNTTVSGWVVPTFKRMGFEVVCLVHELSTLIGEYGLEAEAEAIGKAADVVVFPAVEVEESFASISGPLLGKVVVQPQGLYRTELLNVRDKCSKIRASLGIPQHAKIVVNVGYADARKGFDLFIRSALRICAVRPDIYFVWVGDGTADVTKWQMADVRAGLYADRIILTGFVSEVDGYYAEADAFFLTSREDPFPSVVLEAMAAGLPVIAFDCSGGCVSLARQYGQVVDRNDQEAIDRAVIASVDSQDPQAAQGRRDAVLRDFLFDGYAHDLLKLCDPDLASVSVAVPSYNYARYMDARLGSVFSQTYPTFETLVLDDASKDGSPDAAIQAALQAGRMIDLFVNDRNSGNVFRQWRAAADRARGEYLWIAEADDVADHRFLEKLVGTMEASGAAFGFTDSWQIGSEDEPLGDSYRPYINSVCAGAFDSSFVMDGRDFLTKFLSVKNVILNVSGVVWRRSALVDAMDAIGPELYELKVAGDWRLYAQACLSGSVAYEVAALNGHRRHSASVTHALAAQRHLDEILMMQEFAGRHVSIDQQTRIKQRKQIEDVRQHLGITGEQSGTAPPLQEGKTFKRAVKRASVNKI